MSKLEAYIAPTADGTSFADYYLKSEADKVIAELKKACKDKDDWCLHTLKENRHHKYKRCLAMAKWCVNGEYKLKRVKMRDMNNHQFWQFDTGYWKKWHKRWMKLAEQFKEAK